MGKLEDLMLEETEAYYRRCYVYPDREHASEVSERVSRRAEEEGLSIGHDEVESLYREKLSFFVEKAREELRDRKREETVLTNMCMVTDGKGRVLVLDKRKGGYTGLTFPGGHVEKDESLYESVIREVWEESGLLIASPELCGIYHWREDGVHNIILLCRASFHSGELKGSEEGRVFWMDAEEYRRAEKAGGMDQVLRIVLDGEAWECEMRLEEGRYREYLH